jgi:hypothetical protein
MPVTAAARSEKRSDVAAASLLTTLNAGDERLSTDAENLTQQNFSAEGYQPEYEEEDMNLDAGLIANILQVISNLPYILDLGR